MPTGELYSVGLPLAAGVPAGLRRRRAAAAPLRG